MEDYLSILWKEVQALFGRRERVPELGHGYYSHYFVVPKKDGGLWPILDLCLLSAFLQKEEFKMLTLAQVLSTLNPGDWRVVLDLQDA